MKKSFKNASDNRAPLKQTSNGDGHPVLVIPGFLTNDFYMADLRGKIAAEGYKAYGWAYGVNLGASKDAAAHLEKRLLKISSENEGKKVSLIGFSLGGVYARELARKHPELVRDVITLGAPFGLKDRNGEPDKVIRSICGYYQGDTTMDPVQPPPVPTTSIFSREDEVVDWRTSVNALAEKAENVTVTGGHILLPFNSEAVAAVLDRLSQADGSWHPFKKLSIEVPKVTSPGASANDPKIK